MNKSTQEPGLKMISLKDIVVSGTNPRKTFDEKALSELTVSIKDNGVLQPILVRPKGDKYELVCGERRYRASMSVMTAIKTRNIIPVIIKELTDDEAFEFQIIENLERKDVHPLEEAEAFQKMLDSGRYTVADIAAKFVKSEIFVVQRLKLTALIDDLKKDFLNGYLAIGHAILLARCEPVQQSDFYRNAQGSHGDTTPDYGTVSELKHEIECDSNALESAIFDRDCNDLVSGCVACNLCSKRSGYNPILFEDMQENDLCFDDGCYKQKTAAHLLRAVNGIIESGSETLLLAGYGNPSPAISDLCKKFNVSILKRWDDYHTYLASSTESVARKGLVVSGSEAGKFEDVFLNKKSAAATQVLSSSPSDASELSALAAEISRIESRAARSLELDAEKEWSEMLLIDTSFKIQHNGGAMTLAECRAIVLSVYNKLDWSRRESFRKAFLIPEKVDDLESFLIGSEMDPYILLNRALRIFFTDVLSQKYGSHKTHVNNAAYAAVLDEYYAKDLQEIHSKQNEAAAKRISNAEKKIEGLRAEISAIKAKEIVKPLPEDKISAVGDQIKKSIKKGGTKKTEA